MDTTFSLFGLTAHAYGLCAALAAAVVMLGVYLKKQPCGTASLFTVLAVAMGVAGARLLYCVCNVSAFTETYENAWLMLCFFDGGFSWPGMAAGVIAAAAITARVMHIRFADLMDAVCLPAGLALALLRFGEQFTDLGVGKAVSEGFATANLPWLFSVSRMGVAVEYRLNVWAYEAVAGIVIFALVVLFQRVLSRRSGDTALFFAALFGASQILFESMRDDGHMLLIFLRIGQLGAAALVIAAWVILTKRASKAQKTAMWIELVVCVIAIVLLEFSLDGRLTFGNPTLLRDYSIMAAVCAVLFAHPCALLFQKARKCASPM